MSQPVDCPYYHADHYRGRDTEKCRLIERNRQNRRPWKRALCDTCPIPEILRRSTCRHLALEASVVKRFGVLDRVEVYAICTEHVQELADPKRCPACEAEASAER